MLHVMMYCPKSITYQLPWQPAYHITHDSWRYQQEAFNETKRFWLDTEIRSFYPCKYGAQQKKLKTG
jgi:hypothetical protein